MPSQFSIPTIIQIYKISSYLSGNDAATKLGLTSGFLSPNLQKMILMEGSIMESIYNLNNNDSNSRSVAEYVLALCGQYGLAALNRINGILAGKPVITNPSSVSVTEGGTAVFFVTVTSSTPYTVQWYRNGVAIPGATSLSYTLSNAQLSDNGAQFNAIATNPSGTATSNEATLTVTEASLFGYYYFGSTDYSTELQANTDNVIYAGTFPITTGQPLSFTWPSGAANNVYLVVKYPATESIKTAYANAPLNNGTIPSIAFGSIVTFGGWNYIYSRTGNPFSQNTAAPLIFS